MKRISLFAVMLIVTSTAMGQTGDGENSLDVSAIKDMLNRSYIDGIHRNLDPEAVSEGFHPDFLMHVRDDGALLKISLQEWLEHLDLDGTGNTSVIDYMYESVSVVGDAATVQMKIFEDDELIYTDFFGLYRFENGWKVVYKIFHDHD